MAFFRSIWRLLKIVVGLLLAALLTMLGGGAAQRVGEGEAASAVAVVSGLIGLWVFVIRPVRRWRREEGSAAGSAPASVVGIERLPPAGAPWYYWTFVTFDSRGRRIRLHLSKKQAKRWSRTLAVGDVGHLRYDGNRLVSWERASSSHPVTASEHAAVGGRGERVFLSYAREWADDAAYLEEFFRSRGFDVWRDEHSLRFGDRLRDRIFEAIQSSAFFILLLSPEYLTSEWCIDELQAAADAGCRVIPLKVSDKELVLPPHLRQIYRDTLGDPAYLDLRGRNPVAKLEELVHQMGA